VARAGHGIQRLQGDPANRWTPSCSRSNCFAPSLRCV
jgi:hypothetical protein